MYLHAQMIEHIALPCVAMLRGHILRAVVLSDTLKQSLPPVGPSKQAICHTLAYTAQLSSSHALRCRAVELLITRKSVADGV